MKIAELIKYEGDNSTFIWKRKRIYTSASIKKKNP